MENVNCNIDKTDKIHRIIIGSLLLLGVVFNMGKGFMLVLGSIVLIEGILGKCGIPYLISKYEQLKKK